MVISIVTWYLALQLMAVVGLPLAFAALRRLPSRGYATAKALGLLLTGVVFWWGGILHLWPNTRGAALAAAGVVLALGLLLMRGRWDAVRTWWRDHHRHALTVESLFLTSLVLWSLVRASQPQLQTAGGEKWMEIAFLNANLRAPDLPPHDPWLSGFAISYYYLGYLLMSVLTRLTLIPAAIAFNLSNAGWFALVAVQAYGIVYDLLGGRSLARPLLGPLMVLLAGNGEGLLEVLHARGLLSDGFWAWMGIENLRQPPQPPYSWVPQRFFWWWQASRTLLDTTPWGDDQTVIDEFPAFSFILGDMHPHLLALPFVLVAVALALNAYHRAVADPEMARAGWSLTSFRPRLVTLGGYAVVLGALGFLNTWDFPIYWALLVGAWLLGRYVHAEKSWSSFLQTLWATVPEAFVLGVLSVVAYLPFWIALRSQAGGILPNLFNATRFQQFAVMFLPLLVPLAGVVANAARRRGVRWHLVLGTGVALTVAIALVGLLVGSVAAYPYLMIILRAESVQGYTLPPEVAVEALLRRVSNPWTGLLLAFAVGAVLLAVIEDRRTLARSEEVDGRRGAATATGVLDDRFPMLLALLGLLLTLAPEFVYLQDVFMTRMNTVFKFYFQAWVLWGLAGAWQVARWLGRLREGRRIAGAALGVGVSALLIAAGLVYTTLAIPARARENGVPWTLDGAAWMEEGRPADLRAIRWLNAEIEGAPVIVEAPGDQHRAYVYEGRVSALTGLTTVLGWGGHQRQWRGNYDEPARREADLERLFTTVDPVEAWTVLELYDVRYLYIGPVERQRYPPEGLAKFATMFPAVYDRDDVVIYAVTSLDRAEATPAE
jgi:YYY domain-containing protein